MLPVILSLLAERDVADVYDYLALQGGQLLQRFDDELNTVLETIAKHPHRFPEYEHGSRRALLRSFPYKVIYQIGDESIRVIAVYHAARDPERWDDPHR
jgi:plasmid stabilization system protein ParE